MLNCRGPIAAVAPLLRIAKVSAAWVKGGVCRDPLI